MLTLRAATTDELPLFHAMEQDADTSPYILKTSLEQHGRAHACGDIVYLAILDRGELAGYFILALDDDGHSVELRRIVIADKGRGVGQRAMRALEPFCRDRLQRERIWLDVYDFNHRGRHVYESLGYQRFDQKDFEGKRLLFYDKIL